MFMTGLSASHSWAMCVLCGRQKDSSILLSGERSCGRGSHCMHALKCATKEISVTKCRVEYRHHSTNGMKTFPVTNVMGDTFVTC